MKMRNLVCQVPRGTTGTAVPQTKSWHEGSWIPGVTLGLLMGFLRDSLHFWTVPTAPGSSVPLNPRGHQSPVCPDGQYPRAGTTTDSAFFPLWIPVFSKMLAKSYMTL